jgi:hypothetical protein
MRLSVGTLRQVVKRDLPIAFVPQQLTSYGGLELLRRYVRRLELPRRLQAACSALGGDYGSPRLALLLLALPYVGARRLEHLQYLVGDPLVRRFAGLARMPTARTVSNWLRRFTQETLRPLVRLNQDLVLDTLARLDVPRLTLDVDGTIVRTGATVAWAFRGFNPHHRKDRSYYPLLAHVAQTGHVLRIKNRPGNVHDSKQSVAFLRELIDGIRARLGRRLPLEFRMDAAFFQPEVLRLLAARGCAYAIKLGYWSWLPLKQLAADRQRWHALAAGVTGFEHRLVIPQWGLRLRVMIYRKHVRHVSPKNFQLDLFTPDDGHFEYYAVATNMPLSLPALYAFIGGRGPREDDRRTQGRVRPRCRPDPPLRGQLCVAATHRPRLQRRAELSTRHHRHAAPAFPQAHLQLRPAQHADTAFLADHPSWPAHSHRGTPDPPAGSEPGH